MRPGMENFINYPIYAITAEAASGGRSNYAIIQQLLDSGIKFIQYREKTKSARERYEECQQLRELTRRAGATFIIDDFVDLAMAVDADGVHIGQTDLPPEVVRQLLGPNKIIGLSTHSPEQLLASNALGELIDYIGVGPIFATPTKADAVPVGFDYVDFAVEQATHPFVAIGGIKAHNIAQVAYHGATTFALVTEIVGAADIPAKLTEIRAQLIKKEA